MSIVISAFPCCGKSYATKNLTQYKISDLDSSQFAWIRRKRTEEELENMKEDWDKEPHLLPGSAMIEQYRDREIQVRNSNFIADYIAAIKERIDAKDDIIFVSTHLEVRQALTDNKISFMTIYPHKDTKVRDEWLGRMFVRGSSVSYMQFQLDHWEEFTTNIIHEPYGKILIRFSNGDHIDEEFIDRVLLKKK